MQDPYPAYDQLRTLGVLRGGGEDGAAWWDDLSMPVFAGHAAVSALLRDRRFGRENPTPAPVPQHLEPFHAFEAHSLLEREPPAHTRLRKLVNRAFVSRAVGALEGRVTALAESLVDGFSGDRIDLLEAYATPIPMTVIAELLGAPAEASSRMLAWSHDMVAMYEAGRTRAVEDRAVAATLAFSGFMREVIAARRARPGEALIDELIAAREDGDRLTEDELVTTCILLLNAGHEATVHAIGNAVKLVLEQGLDRAAFAGPGAEQAADETLRVDPPLHLFTRFAMQDVEACGLSLRRGEQVGLLLGGANRDPAVFPDPGRADLARANAARHVAFGGGLHFCVGAPLARLELRVALDVLFRRLPELRMAGTPVYAPRWHFHGLGALEVTA